MYLSLIFLLLAALNQRSSAAIVRCLEPRLAGIGSPQIEPGCTSVIEEIVDTMGSERRRHRERYAKKVRW